MITTILTSLMMLALSLSTEIESPVGMESLLRTDSISVIQFCTDGSDTLAVVAGSYESVPFLTIYTESAWQALRDSSEVTLAESEPVAFKGRAVTVLGLPSEL